MSAPAVPAPVAAAAPLSAAIQPLSLAEPLPGFPEHRDYVLIRADAEGVLYWLQSAAPEGPRFLAVPPAPFFPDYTPVLPAAVCAELDLPDRSAADLYCLVTVLGGDVQSATANLRAPLVVNPLTRRARQVVLADGGHPIRRSLRR
jgi:flagellar assembly factor FliW